MHDIEWDVAMCLNVTGKQEIERLYKIALTRKLEIEEENRFKEDIKVIVYCLIDCGCSGNF